MKIYYYSLSCTCHFCDRFCSCLLCNGTYSTFFVCIAPQAKRLEAVAPESSDSTLQGWFLLFQDPYWGIHFRFWGTRFPQSLWWVYLGSPQAGHIVLTAASPSPWSAGQGLFSGQFLIAWLSQCVTRANLFSPLTQKVVAFVNWWIPASGLSNSSTWALGPLSISARLKALKQGLCCALVPPWWQWATRTTEPIRPLQQLWGETDTSGQISLFAPTQ